MVCLGNICRSPLAHGLLRDKIEKNKLSCIVDSCGTSSYHIGEQPDKRMIETAVKHGYDISSLKARQFIVEDFENFDMIYVMDSSNYNNVVALARTEYDIKKVKLFLNELYPNMNMAVPDPYFGGVHGFEEVFDLVDKATDVIVKNTLNER